MKRRQHYVWRKYLEPWCVEQKLWCLRKDESAPFCTNPINVAVERDFYRIQPLEPEDFLFIKKLAISPTRNEMLKQINEGWLSQFNTIFALIGLVEKSGKLNSAIQLEINRLLNDIEEDGFNKLEDGAVKYLDQLVEGKAAFLEEADGVMEFSIFLAYQYFRTKKMQDSMLKLFSGQHRQRFERCWPVLRHIFATNVAFSVFANRDTQRPVYIRNYTSRELITSDQPVINTYAAYKNDLEPVEKVELYYPVSPQYAVIFTDHAVHTDSSQEGISEFRVEYFNQLVEASSHLHLFGSKSESLSSSIL